MARKVRLVQGPEGSPNFCFGLVDAATGAEVLFVQSDWDWAGLASAFGWTPAVVQKCKPRKDFDFKAQCGVWVCEECRAPLYPMEVYHDGVQPNECPECGGQCHPLFTCDHDSTDGTVPCKECGVPAGDFLASAFDWLEARDGEVIECDDYNAEDYAPQEEKPS